VTGSVNNLNPKKTVTYSWIASNGATVTGTLRRERSTRQASPGQLYGDRTRSEGTKPGQFADCTAALTVKQFEPPTISCSVNPTSVQPGGTATVSAQG